MFDKPFFDQVLLIEDDPSHALLIKRALQTLITTVFHAKTMQEGIGQSERESYQLVITDLNLPDCAADGVVEVFRRHNQVVPMIVLTSSSSLHDAVEAMRQGARDFIVKDFSADFATVLAFSLARLREALDLECERAALQGEMRALRAAIENSQDGLAVCDRHGLLYYANQAFIEFVQRCGGNQEHIISVFSERVANAAQLKKAFLEQMGRSADVGVWHTELVFIDNKEQAYDLSVSRFRDKESRLVVWVRNVSEQKRRERFQREILSTTTHDLKGPLGAIKLSSELLLEMLPEGSKTAELVVRVGSSAQGAIGIIDEFLSARLIEEGAFIMRPVEVDLGQLLSDLMLQYKTVAAARKIEFSYTGVPAEQGLTARVAVLGVTRVVGNLLSNAFKFTPQGGVVTLYAENRESDVIISVCDTGHGMEPGEVQKIFERFSRLDRHSEISGSGLGLFVVKNIVSAHGGTVEVSSEIGSGTTFTLCFPKSPTVNERGELISLNFV